MLKLDEKEKSRCDEILKACDIVSDLAEDTEPVDYYFEVKPTSIGQAIILVVPKYSIKQDITNYSNW